MVIASRDLKRAVEFGLIVESRLEWSVRTLELTIYTLDMTVVSVHRVRFEGIVHLEWTDSARDAWHKLELSEISIESKSGSANLDVTIDLWNEAVLSLSCTTVLLNGEPVSTS